MAVHSAGFAKASPVEIGSLVQSAQRGDRAAFGELYARYAGMVFSIAMSSLPRADAADVVQESFLRALGQLKSLRDRTAFGAWLARIARNVVVDVQRLGRHRGELEEEPVGPETQHDELLARAALRAIRSLPDAYRETLMMRLVQGMTGPEIADRTGLTPASVRVNLHRGLKLLRQQLERSTRSRR